ncbi:MAG: DinB family protein [Rhodothermales bacterium]|nr:DinB family protein [Rhodothermales bacterium]
MKSITHPHLIELARFVNEASGLATRLRKELTPSQLRWRSSAEVWSVADCFDHLISTGYLYYPRLEDAIDMASTENIGAEYEPSVLSKLFIWTVSPDAGIKVTAFQPFEPKHVGEDVRIMDMFIDQQAELIELLRAADGVDINSGKFTTPGLVRLTVGEGLTMVVQHQRRHVLQIQSVLDNENFPTAEAVRG